MFFVEKLEKYSHFKDNLPAAHTWWWNLPTLYVIIKYKKSQMKFVSHEFNLQLKCHGISNGY